MLCLLDTVDYPSLFLGAIKAGIVPIPTNTMLSSKDYRSMLADSTAQALVVSDTVLPAFEPILASLPHLRHVIIVGENARGRPRLYDLIRDASDRFEPSQTSVDDMCYWLCTSGSTGTPKGAVHLHSHLMLSAELYARGILAMCEDDIILSASKLFFTYGLGTSLTFPIATGARTILTAARSTPETMFKLLAQHRPTVFFGIPSLYAAMLAMADPPERSALRLRVCVSAGEPLPAEIGKRWRERFGCDILDGMGSSEMGHIFISNRSDELRYGSSGKPVPGYKVRIADDAGRDVAPGEIGDVYVSGPTSAIMYWNNRERTKATFQGPWTKTSDNYCVDEDGYYIFAGRSDDMFKVSGQLVSPFEVEAALVTHPDVLEAAVIGLENENRLIKPKAFIVLKGGRTGTPALVEVLRQHVKTMLAPYKCPRWIEFVPELPKTAAGKTQRFKLRESAPPQPTRQGT